MLKYKKLIEALRLILFTTIGISMAFHWINIIFGLFLALILGLIDQIFVKPYIKRDQ
jgi:preprotein translocase subunit SecE